MADPRQTKRSLLRQQDVLNPRPEEVRHENFRHKQSKATFLVVVSGAAMLCQTPRRDAQPLLTVRNDFATGYPRPIGALASHNAIPVLPARLDRAGSTPLTLPRFSCCYGTQAISATSRIST